MKRGYDEQQLDSKIQWALDTPRDMDSQPRNDQETSACIPLVVTYHPALISLGLTTRQHQNILRTSERLQNTKGFPFSTVNCLSLDNKFEGSLGQSGIKINTQRAPGNWRCDTVRCKMCSILMTKDEFASHTTGQRYKVKGHASCKSSNIIYLIECKRCGHQCIGETSQPLRCRIIGHRSYIMHQRTDESPVVVHFNTSAHSVGDMAVMVIDNLYSLDPTLRKMRESRWIRNLRTEFPQGLNPRVDSLWIRSPLKTSEHCHLANRTISGCTVLPATIIHIYRETSDTWMLVIMAYLMKVPQEPKHRTIRLYL